ncbi:unnamed protein product [Caretta caretta]
MSPLQHPFQSFHVPAFNSALATTFPFCPHCSGSTKEPKVCRCPARLRPGGGRSLFRSFSTAVSTLVGCFGACLKQTRSTFPCGPMGQSLQPEPSGDRSGGRKPAEMEGEGSELERGLHAIVGSFYRYAEGAKELDQAAFQTLLSNELSHQLTSPEDQQAALDLFKKVDANNDQKISFDEYWDLIVEICRVIRRSTYNE